MLNEPNKKPYTPPQSPRQPNPWINIVKAIYEFSFFVIIIIGIIGFIFCIKFSAKDDIGAVLIVFIALAITAVLTFGFVFIFLELAKDVRDMVSYVYQIGAMIIEDKNRDISGDIENTAENIYQIKTILENNSTKKE